MSTHLATCPYPAAECTCGGSGYDVRWVKALGEKKPRLINVRLFRQTFVSLREPVIVHRRSEILGRYTPENTLENSKKEGPPNEKV